MKIAFAYHTFQSGSGIEQVILDLSRHLRVMGHEVMLVTYSNERDGDIPVAEFKLPVKTPGGVFAPAFLKTNDAIRKELVRYDVAVTSLYPMNTLPLFPSKINSKVVFVEWGIQPYSAYKSPIDKAYVWLLNRADRYAIKRSDMVIVANEVTRKWVEVQGVKPVKLNLYGIDFERLAVDDDCGRLLYRHRELLGADGAFMYAGRQSPHKNIEVLIRAIGLLKKRGYNAKLLIVGRASFTKYAGWLRDIVGGLNLADSVIFTGLVSEEDLAGYYSLCDAFVNASSWEGFLIPEPYAFKKPIIAYGVPPHDETVKHGITGLLVNGLNPTSFATSMEYLLNNREKRLAMGEAGYRWANENLDYRVIARKFIDAIGVCDE